MLKRTTAHKSGDAVNHPTHYNVHPSGVECIDVIEHMTFNVGNAIKYLWRAGHKGNLIEDVEKARWHIDREIVRLKKQDEEHKASLQLPSLPSPRKPMAAQQRALTAFLKWAGHKPNAKRVAKIIREWEEADARASPRRKRTGLQSEQRKRSRS